jgi:hypothetical protein
MIGATHEKKPFIYAPQNMKIAKVGEKLKRLG